jgi:hypothetical protein
MQSTFTEISKMMVAGEKGVLIASAFEMKAQGIIQHRDSRKFFARSIRTKQVFRSRGAITCTKCTAF